MYSSCRKTAGPTNVSWLCFFLQKPYCRIFSPMEKKEPVSQTFAVVTASQPPTDAEILATKDAVAAAPAAVSFAVVPVAVEVRRSIRIAGQKRKPSEGSERLISRPFLPVPAIAAPAPSRRPSRGISSHASNQLYSLPSFCRPPLQPAFVVPHVGRHLPVEGSELRKAVAAAVSSVPLPGFSHALYDGPGERCRGRIVDPSDHNLVSFTCRMACRYLRCFAFNLADFNSRNESASLYDIGSGESPHLHTQYPPGSHFNLLWGCGIRDSRILRSQYACLCCEHRAILTGCEVNLWSQLTLKFTCECRGLCTANHRPLRIVVIWQLVKDNKGWIDQQGGLTVTMAQECCCKFSVQQACRLLPPSQSHYQLWVQGGIRGISGVSFSAELQGSFNSGCPRVIYRRQQHYASMQHAKLESIFGAGANI